MEVCVLGKERRVSKNIFNEIFSGGNENQESYKNNQKPHDMKRSLMIYSSLVSGRRRRFLLLCLSLSHFTELCVGHFCKEEVGGWFVRVRPRDGHGEFCLPKRPR